MFFSVNTFMWTGAFTQKHLPLLEQLKHWGADGVEFACSNLETFPVDAVRQELGRLGLSCTMCTSPPSIEHSLIHPNASARRAGLAHLREALYIASSLGATTLAGPLYAKVGWFTGQRRTAQEFDWAVEAFASIGPDLAHAGIDLAIEPMNRFETFFMATAAEGVQLCEAVNHPRIGLMLDTAHMAIEEKDMLDALRTSGPWLKHLQTSEPDRGTPGSGSLIDWHGLFRTLQDMGYAGGCAIESFPWHDPEVAANSWCWRELAASPEALASDGLAFLHQAHAEATQR